MINSLVEHGTLRYLKATAIRHLTAPLLQVIFESYTEYLQHVGPDAVTSVCVYEHFPPEVINSVPKNATAFATRGEWSGITIHPNWGNNPEFDRYTRNWVHALVDKLAAIEKADSVVNLEEEVACKNAYYNGGYFGDEKTNIVFGANYPRLRELKRKYDPEFVFRKWFPIKFID